MLTRRIAKLEKEGLVEYTAIPNLGKLDVEIMAFSFNKWTNEAFTKVLPKKDFAKKVQHFLSTHPNVIFATTGGSGLEEMNSASISIHKDYADYSKFAKEIKTVWGKYVDKFDSFIVSLKSNYVVRHITFKVLAEYFDQVYGTRARQQRIPDQRR